MGVQLGVLLAALGSPSISPTHSPWRWGVEECAGQLLTVSAAQLSTAPLDNDPLCDASACINGIRDNSSCTPGGCCTDTVTVRDGCHSVSPGVDSVWLRLDLTSSFKVGCVGISLDGKKKWLLGFHEIRVGNDASSPTNNPLCSSYTGKTKNIYYVPHKMEVNCEGQYVFVYLPPRSWGVRILNIAEVEVHADTSAPTLAPTTPPSVSPSTLPSGGPTLLPSASPSQGPSLSPSTSPVPSPTVSPSSPPSEGPTLPPLPPPSQAPLVPPSVTPTPSPETPSMAPSATPPSEGPTVAPIPLPPPSQAPLVPPSVTPTLSPGAPSMGPSATPPSEGPTVAPIPLP
eukprot:Hpha_TRINITY_DN14333_c0_g1::TRINITY_DN14333_c0_g1_i2::g.86650::m.86650